MKKLETTLLMITIIISFNAFSQVEDFDLSKYKLPDLKRRTLDTYFNLNGSNNYYMIPEYQYSAREKSTNSYGGDLNLVYNYYLNNEKFQKNSFLIFNLKSNYYDVKIDKKLYSRLNSFLPDIRYQYVSRKYFNEASFFETDIKVSYSYTYEDYLSRDDYQFKENSQNNKDHDFNITVPLKYGKGRIENVQDARQAVFIVKELMKINRFSKNLSDDDVLEFAQLISEIKNRRFFDGRLRKIADIISIDSFFISKGYINEQDAKYFTTLNDYWLYGDNQIRKSGTRFSFTIAPSFNYRSGNHKDEFVEVDDNTLTIERISNLNSISAVGGFELNHEKPINQKWQNSIYLNVLGGIVKSAFNNKTQSEKSKYLIPTAQIGFFQTIGFYPNTRTDAGFLYSVEYAHVFKNSNSAKDFSTFEKAKAAKTNTTLWINYYISPKFRAYFNLSFFYIWQESEDDLYINFSNDPFDNYLVNSINNRINQNNYFFKTNELVYNFKLGLVYSIF